MKNEGKIDAVTLRKLREIRGLSRKEAAVLLGMGHKSVEKFENGRTLLNKSRIEQAVRTYGFTHEDFLLCREGKSEQIKKDFVTKQKRPLITRKITDFSKNYHQRSTGVKSFTDSKKSQPTQSQFYLWLS